MIVRSYTGKSMEDALEKVRSDLGAKALIIETRSLREPGLLGKRLGYEVVAAGDPVGSSGPLTPAPPSQLLQRSVLSSLAQRSVAVESTLPAADQALGLRQQPRLGDAGEEPELSRELVAIRRQLSRLAAGTQLPSAHLGSELLEYFEDVEMPAELIAELDEAIAQAGDRLPAGRRLDFCRRYLARSLPCPGGLDWQQATQVLMVGPTGVGKTTTIAKLAGELVLNHDRRVALITLDTYRIGACEQLRTYAELLDIPFAIARSPAELRQLLEQHRQCDAVLIDTAGRSPADAARLHELRGYLRAAPGVQVMLALPATCGRTEFAGIVERFSTLPLQRTVLTKLDECAAPGRLLGCLRRHQLPINYFTNGQEVPQDLGVVSADALVMQLLLGPATPAAA